MKVTADPLSRTKATRGTLEQVGPRACALPRVTQFIGPATGLTQLILRHINRHSPLQKQSRAKSVYPRPGAACKYTKIAQEYGDTIAKRALRLPPPATSRLSTKSRPLIYTNWLLGQSGSDDCPKFTDAKKQMLESRQVARTISPCIMTEIQTQSCASF